MQIRLRLYFIVFLALLSACADQTERDSSEALPLERQFYKRMEGTVGHSPAVLHLSRYDAEFNGVYSYGGNRYTLRLDTMIGQDSLVLFEDRNNEFYWDKKGKARLYLKWDGKGFSGTHLSADGAYRSPVKFIEKYPPGSEKLQAFTFTDSTAALPDNKKSAQGRFMIRFLRPEQPFLLQSFSKALDSIPDTNWNAAAKRAAAEFFKNYKKLVSEDARDAAADYMNHYEGSRAYIQYNDHGYLVLEKFTDMYSGGAHGYYFSTFYNYDVPGKRQLKLRDILRADQQVLTTLLEAQYLKDRNLPVGSPIKKHLFVEQLEPTGNFYFNEDGIAFVYHPYEIASYAEGQITVLLPYSVLKNYLTSDFAQRMKIP